MTTTPNAKAFIEFMKVDEKYYDKMFEVVNADLYRTQPLTASVNALRRKYEKINQHRSEWE